jgi:plastocyanin
MASCGDAASPTGSADCREPENGILTITAANLAFDTACLALPAGIAVTIRLVNNDSQPHNVAIYTDSSANTQLFAGEIIDGGETIDYHVPPLDAATDYFNCQVHQEMNGSVVVE